jgi:hypothetical protein
VSTALAIQAPVQWARSLTDEVRRDMQALWAKLLELYEGDAHGSLGYASWHAYCAAEFSLGQSRSYQLLDAAKVVRVLTDSTMVESVAPNERQARELLPLLNEPVVLTAVWREVQERTQGESQEAGQQPRITAAVIREVVRAHVESGDSHTPTRGATETPQDKEGKRAERFERAWQLARQFHDAAAELTPLVLGGLHADTLTLTLPRLDSLIRRLEDANRAADDALAFCREHLRETRSSTRQTAKAALKARPDVSREQWRITALKYIEPVLKEREQVSMDDLRAAVPTPPPHYNSWGPLASHLEQLGWLRFTGQKIVSTQAHANGNRIKLYDSLLYGQKG